MKEPYIMDNIPKDATHVLFGAYIRYKRFLWVKRAYRWDGQSWTRAKGLDGEFRRAKKLGDKV